ncbi:MAG: DUF5320 domain-containing protein [Deltaproteobacteria bacterium]|nr:DUF5320 domain-containing protein [Deltaproteobacteria bacterium]
MPQGDRTGPNGQGPMTGRMAGFCAGYEVPGYASAPMGRGGGGFGRRCGRGYRRGQTGAGFFGGPRWNRIPNVPDSSAALGATMSPERDLSVLQNQAAQLEQTLIALQNRIAELKRTEDNK